MLSRLRRMVAVKVWRMQAVRSDFSNAGNADGHSASDARNVVKLLADGKWNRNKERSLKLLNFRLTRQLVRFVISRLQDSRVALHFFRWAVEQDKSMASSAVYYRLVRSLCGAHRFEAVWDLLDEMRRLEYEIRPELFATLIKSYGRARMVDSALRVFSSMRDFSCEPNLQVYEIVIEVLVQDGRRGKALLVYGEMRRAGIIPSEWIFINMLYASAAAGDVDAARRLSRKMVKLGYQMGSSMYTALVGGYVKAKRTAEAYEVFLEMRKCGQNGGFLVYNMLIVHLCEVQQQSEAFELYSDMSEKKDISDMALNSLVTGLAKAGRTREACEVLQSRGEAGNVITYTVLLNALGKRGACDKALELLEEMRRWCRSPPNVVTYTSVLDGLCKAGRIEQAIKLFREMQTIGCTPNGFTYNVLINGLCKSARLEEAFALVRTMGIKGCRPTLVSKNTLLNGICKQIILDRSKRRFGKQAQYLFLEEMARSFQLEGERLGLLYSCLEYMFGNGEAEAPDLCTYSIVLHFLCKADRIMEAEKVWTAMRGRLAEADTVTYNSFLYGLLRAKDLDGAEKLYEEMSGGSSSKPSIVTHSLLMDSYFKTGEYARASDVYERMACEGIAPDLVLYNIMLNGFCKAKLGSEVNELSADMLHHGVCPSVETYSILIHGLCREGNLETVNMVLASMKERGCSPDTITYNIILQCLCSRGQVEESIKLFREMKRCCCYNAATLSIIIDFLLDLGNLEAAESIFARLIEDGCFPEYITYDTFVDRLLRTDRPEVFDLDRQQTFLSFSYNRIADFFVT